jgi:hypothetical protein
VNDVYDGRNCLTCKYRLWCLDNIVPLGKCPYHVLEKFEGIDEELERIEQKEKRKHNGG